MPTESFDLRDGRRCSHGALSKNAFRSSQTKIARPTTWTTLLLVAMVGVGLDTASGFANRRVGRRRRVAREFRSTAAASEVSSTTVQLDWVEFSKRPPTADAAPPVIFLHGLLGSKRNFASLAASLDAQLDTPRRIFGLDLRNHGTSPWHDAMRYDDMSADVIRFMDSQNMPTAVLVGHSMGGKVAQACSLHYGPDRVAGLVVIDIAPVAYCRESDAHWRTVADVLHALRSVEHISDLPQALPDPALRAFCLTNYDSKKGEWKVPLDTLAQQLDTLAGFDIGTAQDRQYDGDAFFINGGQSRFVRHGYMDTIASFFPNHMLTTIRNAGHWVHAEAPDDTVALLKRYLDR